MMKRLNLGIGVLLLMLFACSAFAQTKTDQFFPDSTKGYVAVSNVNELRAHWRQTALGQVLLSDSFRDFRESILSGIEKAWTGRVGMSIRDTLDLASGEAAFGFVANPGQIPGFVVAIDVTDKKKANFEAIYYLVNKGVIAGFKGGEYFAPNDQCTRGQVVLFL